MRFDRIQSPVGNLLVVAGVDGLRAIWFATDRCPPVEPAWTRDPAPFRELERQLHAYFDGELHTFDLELAPRGTDFQLRVWELLVEIPYGATSTYGELARRLGNPKASRAVGLANGSNPLSIVVPCHRVIGSDGSLTGYGGGLERKRFLLEHEGVRVGAERQAALFS